MSEYLAALMQGAGQVLSFPNILIPVAGTLIAMVSAFLPGIGGTSIATLLLLVTLDWEPESVLLLFGAMTGGATFMGSITAILFNIPGNASSAATLMDGHPMSRQGLPRTAIAAAATASAVGSVIGVVVLLGLLPVVRPFILQFGPLERVMLGIWGLTTIVAIPNSSPGKAIAVIMLGFLAAMIGSDPTSGHPRWTFGSLGLYDGFSTVAVLLGFFTLSEVMSWRAKFELEPVATSTNTKDSTAAGIRAVFANFGLTFRSSILGTVVGIIPGVGGTVASFVAYGQAVQTAKDDRSQFGNGDIRGLIAPEAAVDAKDGGSLLPTLAFGLPGSESGVILLTVLMIHGFVPGMPMLTTDLSSSFTLVFALLLSNILTSVVGVALTPWLARLTTLRIDRIVLPVLVASLVTAVQLNGNITDLYVAAGFGVFGYLLKHFDWPRIPFVIAFVLGGFIEENLALSGELFRVDRLDPMSRPATLVIGALILLSLVWMMRKSFLTSRTPTRHQGGLYLPLAFAGMAIALAVPSWEGGRSYSLISQLTSSITALVMIGVAGQLWWTGRQSDAPIRSLPVQHRLPLLLLVCLIPAVMLVGLPVAAGAFAGAWVCRWSAITARGVLASLVVGIGTAWATHAYLDRFAFVILPEPAILQLFDRARPGV